jgi:hypothetical protein
VVNLHVKLVGAEQRSPSDKDGVCDFENANVDLGVCGREPADKFLSREHVNTMAVVKELQRRLPE